MLHIIVAQKEAHQPRFEGHEASYEALCYDESKPQLKQFVTEIFKYKTDRGLYRYGWTSSLKDFLSVSSAAEDIVNRWKQQHHHFYYPTSEWEFFEV